MWAWLWGVEEKKEEPLPRVKPPPTRLAVVEQTRADEIIMNMPRADLSVSGYRLLVRPTRRSRKQLTYALLEGKQLEEHCVAANGSVEWLALRDPDAFWSLAWQCNRDIVDMMEAIK